MRNYADEPLPSALDSSRVSWGVAVNASAAYYTTPGLFAQEVARVKTPAQTEGPFYPDKLPLDTDNDLIIVNDHLTPAIGDITHLGGKILDAKGDPVRNALVEIWQVDAKAVYIHTGDSSARRNAMRTSRGFGPFPGRVPPANTFSARSSRCRIPVGAPHIHFKVKKGSKELLTTQCYIKGEAGNERDGIYRGIRDAKARDSVTIEFAKMKESKIGELAAKFDIVLGWTPESK